MGMLNSQTFGKHTKIIYGILTAVAIALGAGAALHAKKAHADEVIEQPSGTARFDIVDKDGNTSCLIVDTNKDASMADKVAKYALEAKCKVRAYWNEHFTSDKKTADTKDDGSTKADETTVTDLSAPSVAVTAPPAANHK